MFAWQWITQYFPDATLPGMVGYSEQLLKRIPNFYTEVLKAFAMVNHLNICPTHPSNIWASVEYPGVFCPMVEVGYVEVGDLPLLHGTIDYRTVQQKLQSAGFIDNVFLLSIALQSKFHLVLGRLPSDRVFPVNLHKEAKKLLYMERQHLFDLVQWEIRLSMIDFPMQ